MAVDSDNNIYIADANNHRIRKVDAATGNITTVAGDGASGYGGDGGPATAAQLNAPRGVAVDGDGNIYIADVNNERVRKVTASTGVITTVAGDGTSGLRRGRRARRRRRNSTPPGTWRWTATATSTSPIESTSASAR